MSGHVGFDVIVLDYSDDRLRGVNEFRYLLGDVVQVQVDEEVAKVIAEHDLALVMEDGVVALGFGSDDRQPDQQGGVDRSKSHGGMAQELGGVRSFMHDCCPKVLKWLHGRESYNRC